MIDSLSKAHLTIGKIFEKFKFDYVCILGDRFERLAIANNAIIYNKPIIHLHGGEITTGVIDNQIRHEDFKKISFLKILRKHLSKKIRSFFK